MTGGISRPANVLVIRWDFYQSLLSLLNAENRAIASCSDISFATCAITDHADEAKVIHRELSATDQKVPSTRSMTVVCAYIHCRNTKDEQGTRTRAPEKEDYVLRLSEIEDICCI